MFLAQCKTEDGLGGNLVLVAGTEILRLGAFGLKALLWVWVASKV